MRAHPPEEKGKRTLPRFWNPTLASSEISGESQFEVEVVVALIEQKFDPKPDGNATYTFFTAYRKLSISLHRVRYTHLQLLPRMSGDMT